MDSAVAVTLSPRRAPGFFSPTFSISFRNCILCELKKHCAGYATEVRTVFSRSLPGSPHHPGLGIVGERTDDDKQSGGSHDYQRGADFDPKCGTVERTLCDVLVESSSGPARL